MFSIKQKTRRMNIELKRIYNDSAEEDGIRVLVDKLWPRSISKEEANLDKWWKEVAPSDDLRQWFSHDVEKWSRFKQKYREELQDKKDEIKEFLSEIDQRKRLTLLYAAKDENYNHAVALREYLNHFT